MLGGRRTPGRCEQHTCRDESAGSRSRGLAGWGDAQRWRLLEAAAALACPSPRSVPGIPASPGGGRAIIGHEMSGTDSPETPPRPLAADVALPDLASGKPAPEKEPLRLSDLLVRRLRACLSRGIGPPAARAWGEERPRPEPPGMYRPARFLDAIWCSPRFSGSSVAASSSSSPTTDPPSPDIVPTAGSPCESIVTSGFSSFPLPLTSSESDVSRDEFPSPVTPLRSSSRSPLVVLGLHGSSESRRRPSHTPPCASSSACAARVPWSLEPEPPPSRRRMPPAILFPRRSPPPPPLSPFDSPRAVAGAVSPPSPSASRLPRSSAPPSALGTPDIPLSVSTRPRRLQWGAQAALAPSCQHSRRLGAGEPVSRSKNVPARRRASLSALVRPAGGSSRVRGHFGARGRI